MIAITYTTIYDSTDFVKALVDNIVKYGHEDEAFILTVADLRTPSHKKALGYAEQKGVKHHFLGVAEQKRWLKNFSKLEIPFNSDSRRNVGYLKAMELGADVIVSMDDDNFPILLEDFVGYHSTVGGYTKSSLVVRCGYSDWFNPCSLLDTPDTLFMRGFPFSKMLFGLHPESANEDGNVMVNMGLWRFIPDIYALTFLDRFKPTSEGYHGNQLMIGKNVMLPINSQNTAIHGSVLPCYYFVKMGLGIRRFGDVWQGFFLKKCLDAVGDRVTVGHPLVSHTRHPHSVMDDFMGEILGIPINERLVNILDETHLQSKTYPDAYLELTDFLQENVKKLGDTKVQKYFASIFKSMRVWVEVCDKLQ